MNTNEQQPTEHELAVRYAQQCHASDNDPRHNNEPIAPGVHRAGDFATCEHPTCRAVRGDAAVSPLEFAARVLDLRASNVPVGAEDEVKGCSVFNWLKYAARILREADQESRRG